MAQGVVDTSRHRPCALDVSAFAVALQQRERVRDVEQLVRGGVNLATRLLQADNNPIGSAPPTSPKNGKYLKIIKKIKIWFKTYGFVHELCEGPKGGGSHFTTHTKRRMPSKRRDMRIAGVENARLNNAKSVRFAHLWSCKTSTTCSIPTGCIAMCSPLPYETK